MRLILLKTIKRFLSGVLTLRLVSLHVPSYAVVGDVIKLSCGYDLEKDTLYSIKWYRDDVEFFRYVPRDKPPGQFFPLNGVIVDVPRSTNGTVYIQDTNMSTTGTFKCEVSADAPSFQTVSAQKDLIVQEFGLMSFAPSNKRTRYTPVFILLTLFLLPLTLTRPLCAILC